MTNGSRVLRRLILTLNSPWSVPQCVHFEIQKQQMKRILQDKQMKLITCRNVFQKLALKEKSNKYFAICQEKELLTIFQSSRLIALLEITPCVDINSCSVIIMFKSQAESQTHKAKHNMSSTQVFYWLHITLDTHPGLVN